MTIPPPAEIRRIVYMGTPELAVHPLVALHDSGYEIPLVVSRADKRRGRGAELVASPVKQAARELGLAVTSDLDDLAAVDSDLVVVVAYGRLVPAHVLDRVAVVNIHFSLLPRWRGAAPVERAILAGDTETGVCLMALVEELDAGPIYRRDEVTIEADETAVELRRRLLELGTAQLLDALENGFGEPVAQVGEPHYASKISSSELRLDWLRPAGELHRVIRVGGAWTTFRGRRIKIHRASPVARGPEPGRLSGFVVGTGDGGLELVEIQAEGRARQPASSWVNGVRPRDADLFGA